MVKSIQGSAGYRRLPVVELKIQRKAKFTGSFDFTTLYTGIQAAFLAAAAVGAVVVATRFGARWVKKALGSIS